MGGYSGKERREYLRYRYDKPMKYSVLAAPRGKKDASEAINAISKDLSVSGILFVAKAGEEPRIGCTVVLELDYRTASICNEVDEKALIIENKLIGRVVRLEDNSDGTFDVGVAFVTKTDPASKNVHRIQDLLKKL